MINLYGCMRQAWSGGITAIWIACIKSQHRKQCRQVLAKVTSGGVDAHWQVRFLPPS